MRKLDATDARSASHQIARAIVVAIAEGELRPGEPLPSRRLLSEHFGVANATIQSAIDRLKADGFVVGRQGQGVFVRGGVSPLDMAALVKWLNGAIDQAQRDAECGFVRLPEPREGRDTDHIPLSAGATLVRLHQANRRVVEMRANPLPDARDPDGISLREIAEAYRQYPGFEDRWLPDK